MQLPLHWCSLWRAATSEGPRCQCPHAMMSAPDLNGVSMRSHQAAQRQHKGEAVDGARLHSGCGKVRLRQRQLRLRPLCSAVKSRIIKVLRGTMSVLLAEVSAESSSVAEGLGRCQDGWRAAAYLVTEKRLVVSHDA